MSEKLTGLELRIATLKAAGWHLGVHPDSTVERVLYSLVWPGVLYGQRNIEGVYNNYFESEADAWTAAPPVESSVDAAEKYLLLDTGCGWVIESPIVGHELQVYRTCIITNWQTSRTWHGMDANAGAALCYAFLAWKAGA